MFPPFQHRPDRSVIGSFPRMPEKWCDRNFFYFLLRFLMCFLLFSRRLAQLMLKLISLEACIGWASWSCQWVVWLGLARPSPQLGDRNPARNPARNSARNPARNPAQNCPKSCPTLPEILPDLARNPARNHARHCPKSCPKSCPKLCDRNFGGSQNHPKCVTEILKHGKIQCF